MKKCRYEKEIILLFHSNRKIGLTPTFTSVQSDWTRAQWNVNALLPLYCGIQVFHLLKRVYSVQSMFIPNVFPFINTSPWILNSFTDIQTALGFESVPDTPLNLSLFLSMQLSVYQFVYLSFSTYLYSVYIYLPFHLSVCFSLSPSLTKPSHSVSLLLPPLLLPTPSTPFYTLAISFRQQFLHPLFLSYLHLFLYLFHVFTYPPSLILPSPLFLFLSLCIPASRLTILLLFTHFPTLKVIRDLDLSRS